MSHHSDNDPRRITGTVSGIEFETGPRPSASIIWLHGLGAEGSGFVDLMPRLVPPQDIPVRCILPDAPWRNVTIAGGERLRAWYDIRHVDRQQQQDEASIRASAATVGSLIDREVARGVPMRRIVLGGFSQGGAMALFSGTRQRSPLAGIIALSCYRLLSGTHAAECRAAGRSTPIFLAHGRHDPVIAFAEAGATLELLLRSGCSVEWHPYAMGHELLPEEVRDAATFCHRILEQEPA